MRFDSPYLLYLIPAAAAAFVLLHLWTTGRRSRMMDRFGANGSICKLMRGHSSSRRSWKFALLLLSVSLLIFSAARPQYGVVEKPMRRKGIEVVVAIDCSKSMLSQDIKPNRFERAKGQLRDLIQRLGGDNLGVVAFAGIPIVQCPMTADHGMALNLLDALDVDTVPVQGTNIGAAIRKASGMFKQAVTGNRVLVLLTDGEDNEGEAAKAAEEAAKAGVRIYAIGIGSPEGAPIPLPDGGYEESGGTKVNSRLDFDMLKRIAFATGGKAILANPAGDLELQVIEKDVAAMRESDLQTKRIAIHEERFQYFLFPAVLLLAAESVVGERRRREEKLRLGRYD